MAACTSIYCVICIDVNEVRKFRHVAKKQKFLFLTGQFKNKVLFKIGLSFGQRTPLRIV